MDISEVALAKRLRVSRNWLSIRMCRADFSHVRKFKKDKKVYYCGITAYDILNLERMKDGIYKAK